MILIENNIGRIIVGGRNKDIIYKICENGCHEIISHAERGEYHCIKINGELQYIHRWYFIKMHPEINMVGLDVRHKCDNRHCINIDHLEYGTRKENITDIYVRDRHRFDLTNDEILDIAFTEISHKEMAKKYNIDVKIVQKIRNGKTWSTITGIQYQKKKENKIKFIYQVKGRYRVLIKINNKNHSFGSYETLEEAIKVRDINYKILTESQTA